MIDETPLFERLEKEYENDPEYVYYGVMDDIADKIERERRRQNIGIRQLANAAGVRPKVIMNILHSEHNVRFLDILKVLKPLNIVMVLEIK